MGEVLKKVSDVIIKQSMSTCFSENIESDRHRLGKENEKLKNQLANLQQGSVSVWIDWSKDAFRPETTEPSQLTANKLTDSNQLTANIRVRVSWRSVVVDLKTTHHGTNFASGDDLGLAVRDHWGKCLELCEDAEYWPELLCTGRLGVLSYAFSMRLWVICDLLLDLALIYRNTR